MYTKDGIYYETEEDYYMILDEQYKEKADTGDVD
jgi:hypothetical protein|nr:MAG TPA: hypothetical protein [Caudoviricetes sp.]